MILPLSPLAQLNGNNSLDILPFVFRLLAISARWCRRLSTINCAGAKQGTDTELMKSSKNNEL